MNPKMQALRTSMIGLVLAGLLGAGIARAGIETFDGTGFGSGNTWTSAGAFTGQQDVVWTYANARGVPTVYEGNPSFVLRGSPKGWLCSESLTGGVGRVTATFKQGAAAAVNCDVRVNHQLIGNYKSAGVSGSVETVVFNAFNPADRLPFTNDFTLMVSNSVTSSGVVAIDDLTWEPFRLFVRLDKTGIHTAYAKKEFDVDAEVCDIGQVIGGGWDIQPTFAGTLSDANSTHWTLTPADADAGQTFTLTYAARDSEGDGYTNQASCQMQVLEALNPRFVDFEGASFTYSSGELINLKGMNWQFRNVMTSDSSDRKIGATSARFKHTTALAASMESVDSFVGIGTLSLNYACYETTNRTVLFAVQVHGDGEEWATVPGGTFNVRGHDDITNSVFSVDVGRTDEVWIRLITTGNAEQIANIDNLRIRAYGEMLPRLVFNGGTNAPVGRETVLEFTLANAEGILRDWEFFISPSNANAMFEVMPDKNLQLRFTPSDTNEWGDYAVSVSARIEGAVAGATSVTVRVVSPPSFALSPLTTNIAVPGIVDIWATNVVLHGSGTNWSNAWTLEPPFEKTPSLNQRNRYRIKGTTLADVGSHTVTAVLTDSGTGVKATNVVVLSVTENGGGISNEFYEIVSCSVTNLLINGRSGRVFRAFGRTNLMETNWFFQGSPVTNRDGEDVRLDLPTNAAAPCIFYGVRVNEAP